MASRSSAKQPPARPVRGAGVQMVYERLRQAIVDLELPPGSALDEVRLSQQFALSRTPDSATTRRSSGTRDRRRSARSVSTVSVRRSRLLIPISRAAVATARPSSRSS